MSRLVAWYDGDCPLCRREIALMRRLDRYAAIDFIDIGSQMGVDCPKSREAMLTRFHVREDGTLLSGAKAFAAMWRAIPVLRPLGLAARVPLVLTILEHAYRAFLRVRPRLQRLAMRGQPI